jgi:hypothetical protein
MNAQRRSITTRQIAERTFPHNVDILVPSFGLGQRLNAMLEWCRENVPPQGWDHHGWEERRGHRVDPRSWARFYFMDADRAEAFRRRWDSPS